MFTSLKNILIFGSSLLLIASLGLNWYLRKENKELTAELAIIELRLQTQQEQCIEAINRLNTEIETYSYNLDDYKSNVATSFNSIDTKYAVIVEEVSKDTTLEGQLNTIESLLHDFSNKK